MSTEKLAQIWPEWEIEKQLGKGSYGVVYKAVRRDNNVESYAAIKVISIPSDESEIDSLRSEGLDMDGTRTYFKGIVDDFVSEIQLMESLKGIQNIVSVEDYKVVEKTDAIGWDIYIRMELLTPFNSFICDKKLTEKDVIKLGMDICTALEICTQRNIIHRDIKPENIFVNDFGYFKLGDFGIARKLENMTGGLSQKGTFNYMAPEVANSNTYDARVDIYSLGIVLYRLLNENRLPFLDTEKQLLNPNERKSAVERRIRGEELPSPCEATPEMANLILRACAYNPESRFPDATAMKQALMSIDNGTYKAATVDVDQTTAVRHAPTTDYDATTSVRKAPQSAGSPAQNKSDNQTDTIPTFGKKKSPIPKIITIFIIFALVVGCVFISYPYIRNSISDNSEMKDHNSTGEDITMQQSKQKNLDEAAALAAEGDYLGAMRLIEKAQKGLPTDADYEIAHDNYRSAYEDAVIKQAEELASNQDYAGALALVETAQANVKNSAKLETAKEKYASKLPNEYLYNLQYAKYDNQGNEENQFYVINGKVTTFLGETYDKGLLFKQRIYLPRTLAYNLESSYSRLKGTISMIEKIDIIGLAQADYMSNELCYVEFIGDGVSLYKSPLTNLTANINFDINISNVTVLEIKIIPEQEGNFRGGTSYLSLTGLELYK